jgi:hypothetical protein
MKATAAAALLVVVCACAGCEVNKSTHTPTAPTVDELSSGGSTPVSHPGYPHNGEELIAYISQKYPDRLVPTGGYEARARNMEFVRDKMIDAGICGGMDLARNLKRGVGAVSADAIAWRPDGVTVEVVDIAASWDAWWETMHLQWIIVGGPAGWSPVAPPACD